MFILFNGNICIFSCLGGSLRVHPTMCGELHRHFHQYCDFLIVSDEDDTNIVAGLENKFYYTVASIYLALLYGIPKTLGYLADPEMSLAPGVYHGLFTDDIPDPLYLDLIIKKKINF